MITEEKIIEILKSYSTYIDRSKTDECIHESNFDLIAKDIVIFSFSHSKLKLWN